MRQFPIAALTEIKPWIAIDDVCVDVGAHGGAWTKPLSELVENGHVFAFEALPYYADVLKMTLRLLGLRNTSVISRAVTDGNHPVSIVWRDGSGNRLAGQTHMSGGDEESAESVAVEGISLDSFMESHETKQRVRFVKIDVEGAELLVLQGAVKTIQASRPLFYCEIATETCQRYGYMPADIFAFFDSRDYEPYLISSSSGLTPVDAPSYKGHGNVLFVPSEVPAS